MQYSKWFSQTVNKVGPLSERQLYLRVSLFGLVIFGAMYGYISFLKLPNVLNKSVADTAVVLIGLSMLLSGVCYFWNVFDTKIVYRKHLGLIGFAFALLHLLLSWSAFLRLFEADTWESQTIWAPLTGLIALLIFAVMAAISNKFSALHLGGKVWRGILRTGYVALFFVLAHVVFLRLARWQSWLSEGMKSLPSVSLIVVGFIILVLLMRAALMISLRTKRKPA